MVNLKKCDFMGFSKIKGVEWYENLWNILYLKRKKIL